MKNLLVLTAFAMALLTPTGEAVAQEAVTEETVTAEKLSEARAILEVIYPAAEREQVFMQMISNLSEQYSRAVLRDPVFDDPGLRAIIEGYIEELSPMLAPVVRVHLPQIIEATAGAYAREFSIEELREIRTFAATPAGSHYFRKSHDLLADPELAAANGRYFEAVNKLQTVSTAKISSEVLKYLEANPEVLERLEKDRQDRASK